MAGVLGCGFDSSNGFEGVVAMTISTSWKNGALVISCGGEELVVSPTEIATKAAETTSTASKGAGIPFEIVPLRFFPKLGGGKPTVVCGGMRPEANIEVEGVRTVAELQEVILRAIREERRPSDHALCVEWDSSEAIPIGKVSEIIEATSLNIELFPKKC
jgi:hypothetical protein